MATAVQSLAPACVSLGDVREKVVAGLSGHLSAPAHCSVIFGLTIPVYLRPLCETVA